MLEDSRYDALRAWLRDQWKAHGMRSLHVDDHAREGGNPDTWIANGFASFATALAVQQKVGSGPVVSLVFTLDHEGELDASGLSGLLEEWNLPIGMTPPEIVLHDPDSWRGVVEAFRHHGTVLLRLTICGVHCGVVLTSRVDRYPSGDDVVRHLWIVPMRDIEAAVRGLQP